MIFSIINLIHRLLFKQEVYIIKRLTFKFSTYFRRIHYNKKEFKDRA
ncbi:hypothetical protein CNEO3_400021 [Clostridium neonatale]|nr:hypothetical protein CNEO3_400021 [Clostridium neonatale]CAI3722438.1 hypothetical protein CNEO3_410021 [Clostridium neonatale]